ncbi:O-antigen polysaccharide polymerase Wzy [Ectobacillus polymachus]|uniref:O-antigen polysaccharide polymerase Wzy n=1 Tax=Ectobacillus polymachus TaxID=1508806 RepID=UPI003A855DB3
MKTSDQWRSVLILTFYMFYLIIVFFLLYTFNSIEYGLWLNIFFWITLSHILITFFSLHFIGIKIFSISSMFLIFSYLFHLGQILLKGIDNNYKFKLDVAMVMGSDVYKKAVIFSLLIISLVAFGVMLSNLKKGFSYNTPFVSNYAESKVAIRLGWIIFSCTFPFEVYYSVKSMIIAFEQGYNGVFDFQANGLLSLYARFHLVGIALLIMGYGKKLKKSLVVLLIYSSYLVITMFSGGRMYQIVSIVILMYVFIKSTNTRVNLKKTIFLSFLAFLLVTFLNTMADIRSMDSRTFEIVSNAFFKHLHNNPIFGALDEFGGTIYTVCLTMLAVPNSIEYSHGLQFVTNFMSIFPNINGIFTKINASSNYVLLLNVPAIGGSYIGELYYSFEFLSYLAAIVIGVIVGKVSNKFEYYLLRGEFLKVSYFIIPIFSLFIMIRGTASILYRNTILSICFLFIIYTFFIKKNSRS